MPISSDIYSQFAPKVVNPLDVQNALGQNAQNQLALQQGRIGVQNALQTQQDAASLRQATQGFTGDAPTDSAALARAGLFEAKQKFDKANQEAQLHQSTMGLNASKVEEQKALAALHQQDATIKKHDFAVQQLGSVNSPTDALAWLTKQRADGAFNDQDVMQHAGEILKASQDPQAFAAWKQDTLQSGVSAVEQAKMKQAKAIADQSNATSISNNTATNKTHIQAAGIAASTSRANNADTIKKDYAVAGIGPDGSPSANVESMAQMIAAGKAAPISGFALARPQGQAVMARVSAINPQYDATEYGAKVKAAKDFTSGQQGNSLRSFAVAGQHLDQLGQLADALGNGNIQLVNKIGNIISEQTGSPVPTNFDAAKDVVSKEVVKAIVAGGGGVSERQELKDLMDKAKSPAQLKGVITQYRNLMQAQHDALLQQRDAAGLSRSTLPNYTAQSGASGSLSPAEQSELDALRKRFKK